MRERAPSGNDTPRLRCLEGKPAPAEVVHDWQRFVALPERVLQGLWEILGPSLGAVNAALEQRAEAFCRLYDVPPADLKASLRVCRFLLTRATSLDLAAEQVAEDVAALSGQRTDAAAWLAARYEAAREIVRRGLVEEAILAHGKVLAGLDWRVDRIEGSDRSVNLASPVVVVTLRLREGDRDERTTFYVTPEALGGIKDAWARIERQLAASTGGAR